jgi:hypothetical protein
MTMTGDWMSLSPVIVALRAALWRIDGVIPQAPPQRAGTSSADHHRVLPDPAENFERRYGKRGLMPRTHREFSYTNSDGYEGFVRVSFGPWETKDVSDAPIMVSFEDAVWMGVEQAEEFQRWFRVALSEAKRRHCEPPSRGQS